MERIWSLYSLVFHCDNLLTRTWYRMRHPIRAAAIYTRLRILESGRGYLDA